MAAEIKNYWIIGSTFNRTEDQKDRFLEQGLWEIDNPSDADKQQVLAMQPDDQIAIKAS